MNTQPCHINHGHLALNNLNSLLQAIQAGVFVISDSVTPEQRQEISRELGIMQTFTAAGMAAENLPELPGSFHLSQSVEWGAAQ